MHSSLCSFIYFCTFYIFLQGTSSEREAINLSLSQVPSQWSATTPSAFTPAPQAVLSLEAWAPWACLRPWPPILSLPASQVRSRERGLGGRGGLHINKYAMPSLDLPGTVASQLVRNLYHRKEKRSCEQEAINKGVDGRRANEWPTMNVPCGIILSRLNDSVPHLLHHNLCHNISWITYTQNNGAAD